MFITCMFFSIGVSLLLHAVSKAQEKQLAESDSASAILIEWIVQRPVRVGRKIFSPFLHTHMWKGIEWYYQEGWKMLGLKKPHISSTITEAVFTDLVYTILFGFLMSLIVWLGIIFILN